MTTWFVTLRVEHRGQYAEYNDRLQIGTTDGSQVTEKIALQCAMDMILTDRPDMKGGRVVSSSARPVNR